MVQTLLGRLFWETAMGGQKPHPVVRAFGGSGNEHPRFVEQVFTLQFAARSVVGFSLSIHL